MPKIKKNCVNCGKEFEVFPSVQHRRINCSRSCQVEWQKTAQKGEKNPNYRHGGYVGSPKRNLLPEPKELKSCPECKEMFIPKRTNQKLCTKQCQQQHKSKHRKPRKRVNLETATKSCPICNKEFLYNPKRPKKTCSRSCQNVLMHQEKGHNIGLLTLICPNCWKVFTSKHRDNATFCSVKCFHEYRQEIVQCTWCGCDVVKPKCRTVYEHSFCSDEHRLYWLNSERTEPSQAEQKTIEILNELGIDYEFQYPFGNYPLDFAFPALKIDLEIDSEYHHSLPDRIPKDKRRDYYVRKQGWKVIRIPSQEVTKERILEVMPYLTIL